MVQLGEEFYHAKSYKEALRYIYTYILMTQSISIIQVIEKFVLLLLMLDYVFLVIRRLKQAIWPFRTERWKTLLTSVLTTALWYEPVMGGGDVGVADRLVFIYLYVLI